jgi:hypothetical protein
MLIYGGDGRDGDLDLTTGTEPVEITREMQYGLIKGGPREIRPNGHNIYVKRIQAPPISKSVASIWATPPLNELTLRTQIAFLRQAFRDGDPVHALCDAAEALLAKDFDEQVLHDTLTALRQKWPNDGAEGETVNAVCDALEQLLVSQAQGPVYVEANRIPADAMIASLEQLTDDERRSLFEALFDAYCPHCGTEQGERYCQCNNDD